MFLFAVWKKNSEVFLTQVTRGTYESEVKIFGSVDVQNKAKMLIDNLVASSDHIRGGTEKGKKCGIGGKRIINYLPNLWQFAEMFLYS